RGSVHLDDVAGDQRQHRPAQYGAAVQGPGLLSANLRDGPRRAADRARGLRQAAGGEPDVPDPGPVVAEIQLAGRDPARHGAEPPWLVRLAVGRSGTRPLAGSERRTAVLPSIRRTADQKLPRRHPVGVLMSRPFAKRPLMRIVSRTARTTAALLALGGGLGACQSFLDVNNNPNAPENAPIDI